MALNRTIVAVLSFTLASAAQNQPPRNQPGQAGGTDSVLKTTTRLVIVDVVATNGKSEPVSDLRLQDFKVLENGKQQEVKVFDFQHPGQATASSALPHSSFSLPAKVPPNVVTNLPSYKSASALNIVLLDVLNTVVPPAVPGPRDTDALSRRTAAPPAYCCVPSGRQTASGAGFH